LGGGRESSVSVLLCLALVDKVGLRGMLGSKSAVPDDAQAMRTFTKHVIR
jgi:hypothetical protein